VTLTGSRILNT